jgi:hypothetical protein
VVPILSLWLPIVLAAILVFVVSSIIHMVLGYHKSDFGKVPAEDEVRDALGRFDIPPGEYVIPHAASGEEMKSEAYLEKTKQGPNAFLTVIPKGPPAMGASLVLWFLYSILVGFFAGYVAGRALEPGAPYLAVFRFVGTAAFLGYAMALLQNSIWYKRKWSTTLKSMFDGLVYALLTAGCFGWLWPS